MAFDEKELYEKIKGNKNPYVEEKHCPMILKIMSNPNQGRYSAFCVEAGVCESTFFCWVSKYPVFASCYYLGKMYARENWEKEGEEIKHIITEPGTSNNRLEYWRMMGWSRFGMGKTPRIRLNLSKDSSPSKHYGELLEQAGNGDFTAGEIKQLMEAINVGLRAHEVFELQNQIDELKSVVTKLNEIKHG